MDERPIFPITVRFLEDGEEWVMNDELELIRNLEDFDSDDPEENATVRDKLDRNVRLKIEALELKLIEIIL